MIERSWRYSDAEMEQLGHEATWRQVEGPWNDEPDKIQFADPRTGLPCLVSRAVLGSLCGYVGVAPGHPLHGRHHDDHVDGVYLDAHGGLTFSGPCQEWATESFGICHVPEPGEPDDVWWFGFDCAHMFDLWPARLWLQQNIPGYPVMPEWPGTDDFPRDTYKTVDYVKNECAGLAAQLAKIDPRFRRAPTDMR